MRVLKLKDAYSREDIHGIFSPDTRFTKQSGTWGLQGIIKVPNTERDFVFIVTYGQSQGGHDFDEGITEDGVLSWQSQPKQDFDNAVIKLLISHNDLTDNIYLFLRENKKDDYEYLGRLAYLDHDKERIKPVYFQWQLLDWDELSSDTPKITSVDERKPVGLSTESRRTLKQTFEAPIKKKKGLTQNEFRTKKTPDYAERDSRNRKLGLEGELLALDFEKRRLMDLGQPSLAEKIIHTSVVQGDGAGYDIKSFNEDGSVRFIEVKTTKGPLNTDFFMSPNELKFAEQNSDNFFLYRVYNMKASVDEPSVSVMSGKISNQLNKIATNYKMSFRD